METNIKQVETANNSNSFDRKIENLKNLQKAKFGNGGTVTYHFVTKRLVFTEDSPNGEEIAHVSTLKQPIQDIVLYKRGITEIYSLLEGVCWDLRGAYFTIQ